MQSGLSESLAGRFESIRVTHWSFDEMSAAFDFDLPRYLYFGGYPGGVPFVRDPDRWRDYILGALVEPNIEQAQSAAGRHSHWKPFRSRRRASRNPASPALPPRPAAVGGVRLPF